MPTSLLRAVGPELWCFEQTLCLPPGVRFPARSAVARLPGGELWLHAPLAIDDALAAQLAQLGRVSQIAAPGRFHHLFAAACRSRYPQARLWVAPGLARKRPGLGAEATLAEPAPESWRGQLLVCPIRGIPLLDEYVFLHLPSRSLLVTDFVFHVREPMQRRLRWLLRLTGAHDRLAHSRNFTLLVRDRAALLHSARQLLALDFERLVPAHGEIVERDARAALATALRERRVFRDL